MGISFAFIFQHKNQTLRADAKFVGREGARSPRVPVNEMFIPLCCARDFFPANRTRFRKAGDADERRRSHVPLSGYKRRII